MDRSGKKQTGKERNGHRKEGGREEDLGGRPEGKHIKLDMKLYFSHDHCV